jgi:magnesium chelatase subunit I
VERKGISIKHPARFVLVGSGNPEEGELRPQLLDRFGMHAEIRTVKGPNLRVRVVEERTAFDQNPDLWIEKYHGEQDILRSKSIKAQKRLPNVTIYYDLRVKISEVCSQLEIDGLRGGIVTISDIEKIITLCLRYRLRKDPLESIGSDSKVKKVFNEIFDINSLFYTINVTNFLVKC